MSHNKSVPNRTESASITSLGRMAVSHVGEFSCTVTMWDGEYTVRIDHLKPLNYLESECQQMQVIFDPFGGLRLRIHRLRDNENLEDAPSAVLKHLGEVKRYLTEFEEEILSFIERKCVTRKN
ncbi:hypothetical protein [Nostoc sp.]|uniref:hypothetical protein n=1 Tax=Nostoc sp. TaxID=1180 RepID=UPI002FFA2DE7